MTTIRSFRAGPGSIVLAVLGCAFVSAANSISSTRRRHRCLLAQLTAGVCAAAIAGCGSTGATLGPVTNGSASRQNSFLPFARCMRANGVPNMPDTAQISSGSGINPASPAFQAAQGTCRKLLPGGGPPTHATEQQKLQLLAISECMRSHGITGFPDPTTRATPPKNLQDYSIGEGIGDLWLLVPSTIKVNSPAFKQAAEACKFH